MENQANENLLSLITDIEKNKILLPDFQRKFVWKEVDQQKKIICSILAQMPIGCILLLDADPKEYSCKSIGRKTRIEDKNLEKLQKVSLLIDGQQRLTVLTNVFSNVIFHGLSSYKDIVSPSLKRRFFVKIPKWTINMSHNIWGLDNLNFKYFESQQCPDFLSGDVMDYIETRDFNSSASSKDKKLESYHPDAKLDRNLDNFCTSGDYYRIPLFIFKDSKDGAEGLRKDAIKKAIADAIKTDIMDSFNLLNNEADKTEFLNKFNAITPDVAEELIKDKTKIEEKIQEQSSLWSNRVFQYIDNCINNVLLRKITISADQRARAIDIYEKLNLGGVCLNTFDLLMAKVAKVDKEPFYDTLTRYIEKKRKYPTNVLQESLESLYNSFIKNHSNISSVSEVMKCIDKQGTISNKYLTIFQNVLGLYQCKLNGKEYSSKNISKDEILKLDAKFISNNAEKVCDAIDHALFFFQTRCGISSLSNFNYDHSVTVVAMIFLSNSKYFKDKKIYDILESWHWTGILSGSFNSDQSAVFIDKDLNNLSKCLSKPTEKNLEWIYKIRKDMVLKADNFSDKETVLLQRVNYAVYPKDIIKYTLLNFYLAKVYSDLLDSGTSISVFYNYEDKDKHLEIHHIAPLGSADDVKKIGESSDKLRNDKNHICNSPINLIYITKESNIKISSKSLDEYFKMIKNESSSALHIMLTNEKYNSKTENQKILDFLSKRFDFVQGDILARIKSLNPIG